MQRRQLGRGGRSFIPALLVSVLGACGGTNMVEPDVVAPADTSITEDSSAPVDTPVPPPDVVAGDVVTADATADAGAGEASVMGSLEWRTEARNTGSTGEIDVTVHVEDQRSFMVVANAEGDGRVSVLSIRDPRGATLLRWQDWYNGPRNVTNAFFAYRTGTTVNWPIRAEDPALVPGDYVVRLGSYRVDGTTSRPDVPLTVTTLTRKDTDLTHGRVRVVIVWANGLSTNRALVTATEAAVAHWREVWGAVGMELDVRYVASDLPTRLSYPAANTGELFTRASSFAMDGEVPVVIGETLEGDLGQYGAAGHLPGPVVRSPLRAIVVGWLANAGGDGEFSANDIQLYGEVFAHEVGHYVGLFHPVENEFDSWDALSDTPECRNARNCESMLGTNLMFPYSICDMGTCVSTTILTTQQRAVMHRYTGAE